MFKKIKDAVDSAPRSAAEKNEDTTLPRIRLFSFSNLDSVIHTCQLLKTLFEGNSTLYKDPEDGAYILALSQSEHTNSEFNKICNMLSEYCSTEKSTSAVLAFLEEHCEVIVSDNALQQLSTI